MASTLYPSSFFEDQPILAGLLLVIYLVADDPPRATTLPAFWLASRCTLPTLTELRALFCSESPALEGIKLRSGKFNCTSKMLLPGTMYSKCKILCRQVVLWLFQALWWRHWKQNCCLWV